MSVKHAKNKPFIYGLTGGIGSGKTTATNFFIKKNIKVFDSDLFVKHIWESNLELKKTIKDKYNIDISTISGKKELSNIIFSSISEKAYINSLIHPLVLDGILEFINLNSNEKFLVIDMPLLFEINYEKNVSKTILIYTSKKNQIKRIMKRDNLTKEEALNRINNQMSLKDKKKLADYVIVNNSSMDKYLEKLELLYGGMNDESGEQI
jgi:dephospho-CoA kinase